MRHAGSDISYGDIAVAAFAVRHQTHKYLYESGLSTRIYVFDGAWLIANAHIRAIIALWRVEVKQNLRQKTSRAGARLVIVPEKTGINPQPL